MFGFNFDRKILYIILGALVLMSLRSLTGSMILSTLLTLPGVIIAITFHEFAHAWAADKLGDDTPRYQGRLNLNPMSHIDPVGFMLLLFAGFGWGKPVQINPNNFKRNITLSKGEALVSLAGPLMNFMIAVVLSLIMGAIYKFAPLFIISQAGGIIILLMQCTIFVNIGLGVFNLIPLPPLDGSKIFMSIMPYKARRWIIENEKYFYIAFLIIWISGLSGWIISPIINFISEGLFKLISIIFRLM